MFLVIPLNGPTHFIIKKKIAIVLAKKLGMRKECVQKNVTKLTADIDLFL